MIVAARASKSWMRNIQQPTGLAQGVAICAASSAFNLEMASGSLSNRNLDIPLGQVGGFAE
jgi:hypothetical protein